MQTPLTQEMRRHYNFIGLMMLALISSMQYLFSLVVYLLVALGVINGAQVAEPFLGLDNTQYLLLYAVVYSLMMGGPAVIVAYCFDRRYFPLSPAKPCSGGVAFFGVLFAMGGCMLANIVTNWLMMLVSWFDIPVPESPQIMINTPTSFWLSLLVMAVLPALLEEMVFRGYVMRTLRPYGDWFAVVVSAILFALMHGNIRQIPFAFIVGLLLGWLYAVSDNIWLPVAVHFANNGLSVLLQYLGFSMTELQQGLATVVMFGFLILLGVVAFLVLILGYKSELHLRKATEPVTPEQKVGNLFASPVFVLALLMFAVVTFVETFL